MTLEELQRFEPSATAETWHQHANGGGWVQNSAVAEPSAFVSPNAVLSGNARMFGNAVLAENARMFGNARMLGDARLYGGGRMSGNAVASGGARLYGNSRTSGDARLYGNARIFGNAALSGNAVLYGNARLCGNAQLCGEARLYGEARLRKGVWTKSPLYIQGTEFTVNIVSPGILRIGCHQGSISQWLKEGRALAIRNGFSRSQISEYHNYIELARVWMKIHHCEGE